MGEWAGLRLLCTLHSSWHLGSLNDCICMRMKRPLTRKLPHSHLGGFDLACTLQILWYVNTALRDSDTGTRAYISGFQKPELVPIFGKTSLSSGFFSKEARGYGFHTLSYSPSPAHSCLVLPWLGPGPGWGPAPITSHPFQQLQRNPK